MERRNLESTGMREKLLKRRTGLVAVLISAALFAGLWCWPLRPPPLTYCESLKICDRNNEILRDVPVGSKGRNTAIRLQEVSPDYLKALIAIEDKRFYRHPGIDPLAMARALKINLQCRRIKSGASTITEQLARAVWFEGRSRTWLTKVREMWYAVRLDATLSKHEILEQYVNRVSFGNNCRGIASASWFYLGKAVTALTIADAAFLTLLPQNPRYNNPFGVGRNRTKAEYMRQCRRLLAGNIIDTAECQRIRQLYPLRGFHLTRFAAPHFVEYVLRALPVDSINRVQTTLDLAVQRDCERGVEKWLDLCAPYHVTNASVIVFDNRNGDVLAYVGSRDYWDDEYQGQVDGVNSLRQPGSTLKPFLYALALHNGKTPASLIPDIPARFKTAGGFFEPLNYDKKFHGPVRLREALGCSYNIPAVWMCDQLGTETFLLLLKRTGLSDLKKTAVEYGPGLALGNAEVTLMELARAYTLFPRRGYPVKPRFVSAVRYLDGHESVTPDSGLEEKPVLDDGSLRLVEDILSDNDARLPAFGEYSALRLPFPCAAKTGTSKDFKDNWCVGWTREYTVAVWAGNFDGSSMHHVSGVSGAAPIFHEIMKSLDRRTGPLALDGRRGRGFVRKRICPLSGLEATRFCGGSILEPFVPGHLPPGRCNFHTKEGLCLPGLYNDWAIQNGIRLAGNVKAEQSADSMILSPKDGDIFVLSREMPTGAQAIKFVFVPAAGVDNIEFTMDGGTKINLRRPFTYFWTLKTGDHVLSVQTRGKKQSKQSIKFKVIDDDMEAAFL
ncbi:MAG: penicillin-binding protein 1C [Fibrobacterota bacterium]